MLHHDGAGAAAPLTRRDYDLPVGEPATITLTDPYTAGTVFTGFGFAAVQKNGSIRFNVAYDDIDNRWTLIGHANGGTMSGSQTLVTSLGPSSGSWTATRC